MQLFAVALLLAQTWVSPIEQSYGPYLAPASGSQPAVVASRNRVLLAWSELDPLTKRAAIRTGVLDFEGRLVSEIRTLPVFTAGSEATEPTVATNGATFGVAWLEADRKRLGAIALDASGAPLAPPLRLDTRFDGETIPPLLWSRDVYQLADHARGSVTVGYTFDSNGAPASPTLLVPTYPRFADGITQVGMNWASTPSVYRCGWGIGHGCNWTEPEFVVTWQLVCDDAYYPTNKRSFRYYSTSRAVTAGDADEMAIVWRSPTELTGMRVENAKYDSTFTILKDPAAPEPDAIAFDGEQWLVVFTRHGDIWGAFIDRTSKELPAFAIATSGRKETNARVIALEPGRFLVSYASDQGPDDHRFAGRVVMTQPPITRRRAVR